MRVDSCPGFLFDAPRFDDWLVPPAAFLDADALAPSGVGFGAICPPPLREKWATSEEERESTRPRAVPANFLIRKQKSPNSLSTHHTQLLQIWHVIEDELEPRALWIRAFRKEKPHACM